MTPPKPPKPTLKPLPEIVEIDDTALQILGAYAVKDREFRAKKAAEEAAEKAKKAAQQPPAGS